MPIIPGYGLRSPEAAASDVHWKLTRKAQGGTGGISVDFRAHREGERNLIANGKPGRTLRNDCGRFDLEDERAAIESVTFLDHIALNFPGNTLFRMYPNVWDLGALVGYLEPTWEGALSLHIRRLPLAAVQASVLQIG